MKTVTFKLPFMSSKSNAYVLLNSTGPAVVINIYNSTMCSFELIMIVTMVPGFFNCNYQYIR